MNRKKSLSAKEEEIMTCFWQQGPMFIREVVDMMPDPKPHFNTVATFVRGLETKGWLSHEQFGNSFRYSPVVSLQEYRSSYLSRMVDRLFGKSYLGFVSALVNDEKISTDELKSLIDKIENQKKN
ncbi:MAG: BlaI/MecI/CopY family transcriptional regulator [Muribaculaceae bacterium]|nr:BlaI/MecI/CopY family transcriptional regulator [Muribaculaceae bacterium]